MKIEILDIIFNICKVKNADDISLDDEFCFVSKTDNEISVVCTSEPKNATDISRGWRCFRIVGQLDFSLIGVIAKISEILAKEKIGIFVVSTYNTDYVLTKECDFEKAIAALDKYDISQNF